MRANVRALYASLGVELPDRPGENVPVRCFDAGAHRRDDRNASASLNLEHGAFYCHGCGLKGGPYDAALHLGRSPREAMKLLEHHDLVDGSQPSARPSTATARSGAQNGARRSKGLRCSEADLERYRAALAEDPAALERLRELRGWSKDAVLALGLGIDGKRVVFPVRDGAGAPAGAVRYQPNPERRNGSSKSTADSGSRREMFPAPEGVEGPDLWVVEGEPDAVAGATLNLPAVAVPGTEGWRAEWAPRFAGRRVVVALDGDAPGRKAAKRIAGDLAGQAAEVRVLDLDPSRDDGHDLGDLLREAAEHGPDGVLDLRRTLERMATATEPWGRGSTEPVPDAAGGTLEDDPLDPAAPADPAVPAVIVNGRPVAFMRTDYGNAERLLSAHGEDLRYAPGLGWLAWDGRRWRRDTDGEVDRRMKATLRAMYAEAAEADDEDERKATAAWARKSEAAPRIAAAIALARTESAAVVDPAALDAAPFLLNVKNGTLDLQSGELREHHREDLLTKLAPVAWVPGARDPTWERFLERTTGGDAGLAAFLQRAAGYTLTGDTGEEVLFFGHGPTATGKSTLLEALGAMLGEYALTADFDTFLSRRGDPGVRTDIARLAGARLVTSLEVEDGKHLAEGLLKQLTGGDTVTARFLYSDAFEFAPAFKLWLAANARPRVSADDAALWRRIVQVPFVETVPAGERDPGLKRHLKTDAGARSAILTWALEGALEWQRRGLDVPDLVRNYTADYRRENDPLAEWLDACCLKDSQVETPAAELRSSYESWVEGNGEKPVSATALGRQLGAHGFEKGSTGSRRIWRGVGLKDRVTG